MENKGILPVFPLVLVLASALAGCGGAIISQPNPTVTDSKTAHRPTTPVQPTPQTESIPGPKVPEIRLTQTLPAGLERVQPTEGNPVVGEVPAEILDEIITDLVKRTGYEYQEIEVVRDEAVVWNDGSLGCPKPGEVYIQILVNGYWVILGLEGQEYDYRASDSGYFFLCERGDTNIDPIPLMPVAPHGKPPKGSRTQDP